MIKIFEFLWHGCWHNWIHTGEVSSLLWGNDIIGRLDIYKCEKCSRFKEIKL